MHPVDRFLLHVVEAGPDDCWLWTGALSERGYGIFNGYYGRTVQAHRFAYEMWVGPIPDGLELDHICRVHSCVNPAHLEPVTLRVNILRGEAPSAQAARREHCPQGHPYSGDNLYIHPNGTRRCRECNRQYQRRRWRERHHWRQRAVA